MEHRDPSIPQQGSSSSTSHTSPTPNTPERSPSTPGTYPPGHLASNDVTGNSPTQSVKDAAGNVADTARDAAQKVTSQAGEVLDSAREKMSGVGSDAGAKVDAAVSTTGESMTNLAQTLRDKAPEGKVGDIATSAASALEHGGQYLQGADMATIRADLESVIRQRPVESIAVGVALGFVLARMMRR